jgi:hypothetical protein
MTTLERPLPLSAVVAGLILISGLGFAMGLTNALKDRGGDVTSTAPLAEVSGVPVKDAAPAPLYVPAPPEKPKVKAVEVKTDEADAPAVVEAPPAENTAPAQVTAPPPAAQTPPPTRIEDLY